MHKNIPGLSIDCVDINDPLSNAIAQAFVMAKIFPEKVPASANVLKTITAKYTCSLGNHKIRIPTKARKH
jgi:hypothetical protein